MKEGAEFALKLMKYLKEKVDSWKKETGLGFILYGTQLDYLSKKFAQIDKETFGEIKDITDKGYYTNSYHINTDEMIDEYNKLAIESDLEKYSFGGGISEVNISLEKEEIEEIENLLRFIYNNVQYAKFNKNI